MLAFLFSLMALFLSLAAYFNTRTIQSRHLELLIRLDSLERVKGIATTGNWTATVRYRGMKPQKRLMIASNEADAMRQLLRDGVQPSQILELRPVSGGDVPAA